LQDATLQAELTQAPAPFATVQAWPQAPQLFTSVARFCAQLSLPSQSPSPGWQLAMPHLPFTQFAVPPTWLQASLQLEQCVTSLVRSTSQPLARESSQSAKPVLQLIWQALSAQNGVPLIAAHGMLQPPQLLASVEVLVSQPFVGSPSQSSNGGVH
jgi:hypothetical protein